MREWMIKGGALAVGAVVGVFGEWSGLLTTLALVMVLDYATGLLVAFLGASPKTESGGVNSRVGFMGLARKAVMIAIVLLATVLDRATGSGAYVFQGAAVCYYIANEGVSILENAALMGVPFPKRIKDALDVLRSRGDNSE